MSGAAAEPPRPAGPAFDEIAESAAEYRRRNGQRELTDEEVDLLALDEARAVRQALRERLTHSTR